MKFKEYEAFVIGKFAYPNNDIAKLCCVVGLIEECEEFDKSCLQRDSKEILNEAGDVLWKCHALNYLFGLDIIFNYEHGMAVAKEISIGDFAGAVKNISRKPDHKRKEELEHVIKDFICNKFNQVFFTIGHYGYTMYEVLNFNVGKLDERVQKGELLER